MLLRRGADVASTDGPFGTLTDVVLDPIADVLTHLVVTAEGELRQARVVPIWLTTESGNGVRVELDDRHIHQLQRCLSTDFVRVPATPRADHELRFKSTLCHPYFVDTKIGASDPTGRKLGVPKDGFDMKCGGDVVSTNDRHLGRIVGFLVSDDRVQDVVVRSGLAGFTHDVAVPIEMVAEIVADMVLLDIDRHEFRQLPTTSAVPHERARDTALELARNVAGRAWYSTRDRIAATRKPTTR